ncbi:MAG: dienelactone hydrolase family protein [Verrucomicrobiae bacterium]|nr:dienelactone hydrolase family protein [Verrucomicrobiae bacterium]
MRGSLGLGIGLATWLAAAADHEVAWLDTVQRPPAFVAEHGHVLTPLLREEAGTLEDMRLDWEARRQGLRSRWLTFLGPLSRRHLAGGPAREAPRWSVLEEDRPNGVRRLLIRYAVESDQEVEAYLMFPGDGHSPRPGVVVFHSTVRQSILQPAGIEGEPEKAFGLRLAQQGYVTLSPRNFLWTANRSMDAAGQARRFLERHPGARGMDRMLLDGLVAVDVLASLPEVDSARLGCVGHSLGGKEALYLAAFDERIRATVSSEGGIGTRFSNWHDDWYLGPGIREAGFEREHHELLALVAPRAFLLIGGESADGDASWPFMDAALRIYRLYGPMARLGLFNHRQGHSVPPVAVERMEAWLRAYLR